MNILVQPRACSPRACATRRITGDAAVSATSAGRDPLGVSNSGTITIPIPLWLPSPPERAFRPAIAIVIALTLSTITALGSIGCGRGEPPSAPASEKAGSTQSPEPASDRHDAQENEHGDEAERLQLQPDMLRDLRITIVGVETRAAADTLALLGELRVNEDAYAEVSTPLAARVTRLLALAGDRVRAGQPLVVLQSREIGEALAAWHGARARVTLATQALDRRRRLEAERITPRRAVEEAEADLTAAEAAERGARATLDALGVPTPADTTTGTGETTSRDPRITSGAAATRDSLDSGGRRTSPARAGSSDLNDDGYAPAAGLVLRAPVAGTVLERNAAIGQLAEPAKPLFRIAHLGTLWLTVHAFERDAVRLAPGAPARVTIAALPGDAFAGTIARIGQQVDPVSRTVAVRIDLPNRDARLKPGMSASAAVPIGTGTAGRPVLTVPAAALQRSGERWCVFVPDGPGAFRIRAVARGRELSGEVEILNGLSPTDRVVSDGAFVLKAELDKRTGAGDAHAH